MSALWLYLLLPPLGWLVVAFWPQGSERFGLQWQAFGFGIACALIQFLLDRQTLCLYWDWLKRSKLLLLHVVGLFWLSVMGCAHGFWGLQLEGLLSGFLFLILSPLAFYAWSTADRQCRVAFAVLISLLLVIENLFLSIYLYKGLGFSTEVLDGESFPRIFLHPRDGNTVALAASVVALVIFFSASKSRVVFILLTAVFFNGWITAGRGLFLSVGLGILLITLMFNSANKIRNKLRQLIVLSASSLGFSWLTYSIFALTVGGDKNVIKSMVVRLASESTYANYGRLFIWKEWLSEGLQSNIFFGTGLGVRPVVLPEPVNTPHNIFVQLLSEGGAFSVLCVGALVVMLCWITRKSVIWRDPVVIYCLGVQIVWLNVSAMMFWPVAVWALSNAGAICSGENPQVPHESASIHVAPRALIGIVLLFLLSVLISKKISLWY